MMLPAEVRRDRGETSIQAVLLVPVVLGIFFLGVHATALAHGAHVANAAAIRGAQIAAFSTSDGNDVDRAMNEMERVVTDLGYEMTNAPLLQIGSKSIRTTVTLAVQSIVPFLPTSVTRSATVSREEFLMEQER
ncbi:MAG: hypothetical protein EBW68_05100 [Actinobacteria bacterium]|nr:hypothetical protein [Actinomycetota bacterium]